MASSGQPVGAGGVITATPTSYIHTFDAAANFVPAADGYVDVLIIGGGGGGGDGQDRTGGGGGAGGLRYIGSQAVVKNTIYPVVVGAGGLGGVAGGAAATNGANSSAFGVISLGGGHGNGFSSGAATVGGSGGGDRHGANGAVAGTAGQGFAGGSPGQGSYPGGDVNANFMACGGGGSNAVGQNAVAVGAGAAGAGGAGKPVFIREVAENFAGGGGGGSAWYGSAVAKAPSGAGGIGGGGAGGQAWAGVGVAGTVGTDGTGGGGGGGGRAGGNGAAGGKGRVIIRYSKSLPVVVDDFNRANNAAVVGGPDIGPAPLINGVLGISANQLYSPSVESGIYWDNSGSDIYLQFKIGTITDQYPTIRADVDFHKLIYIALTPTTMDMQRFDDSAGVPDLTICHVDKGAPAGSTVTIIAKGLNIKVLIEGEQLCDVALADLSGGSLFGFSVVPGNTIDWVRSWNRA